MTVKLKAEGDENFSQHAQTKPKFQFKKNSAHDTKVQNGKQHALIYFTLDSMVCVPFKSSIWCHLKVRK